MSLLQDGDAGQSNLPVPRQEASDLTNRSAQRVCEVEDLISDGLALRVLTDHKDASHGLTVRGRDRQLSAVLEHLKRSTLQMQIRCNGWVGDGHAVVQFTNHWLLLARRFFNACEWALCLRTMGLAGALCGAIRRDRSSRLLKRRELRPKRKGSSMHLDSQLASKNITHMPNSRLLCHVDDESIVVWSKTKLAWANSLVHGVNLHWLRSLAFLWQLPHMREALKSGTMACYIRVWSSAFKIPCLEYCFGSHFGSSHILGLHNGTGMAWRWWAKWWRLLLAAQAHGKGEAGMALNPLLVYAVLRQMNTDSTPDGFGAQRYQACSTLPALCKMGSGWA
eukprot:6458724-Amphidinium_carterae.3